MVVGEDKVLRADSLPASWTTAGRIFDLYKAIILFSKVLIE